MRYFDETAGKYCCCLELAFVRDTGRMEFLEAADCRLVLRYFSFLAPLAWVVVCCT